MTRTAASIVASALLAVCSADGLRAGDDALRQELERAFSGWRTSFATRNLAAWKDHTATFRQVETRNLIVSHKQAFPQALFDFPLRAPETGTLRFLKAEAKGPTANVIYFGKVDLGIPDAGEIPENLLMLKFINEAGRWKFDTLRLINLASAPEVRAGLKNGGPASVLNSPELEPSGVVPPTAKLCPPPEYVAALQIASLGYTTTARVNGFELPSVTNAVEQHVIIGGLKSGENTLSLEIKKEPVAEGSARHLQVNAVIKPETEGKKPIRVFSWNAPDENVPATSEQKIIVNKITMRPQ